MAVCCTCFFSYLRVLSTKNGERVPSGKNAHTGTFLRLVAVRIDSLIKLIAKEKEGKRMKLEILMETNVPEVTQ